MMMNHTDGWMNGWMPGGMWTLSINDTLLALLVLAINKPSKKSPLQMHSKP